MAPHGLIATITIALGASFLGGFLATKVRLPPIVGYLAAGIAVGPFTPGLSADPQIAPELAEIGVILLMFGVGIHFSLPDLWSVRWIAIPGAVGQIIIATAVTALVVPLWGWTFAQGVVFGLAISISSTVVLIRTLTDVGLLDSAHGRIAVGWVVVEDLAIVVVLVLLPPLAPLLGGSGGGGGENLIATLAVTLAKVALFGVLMVVVGTRVIPWLLAEVARTGHRELFTLCVLVVAIGVAVVAALAFEVSLALGAFLAGVAISESDLSHQAAAEALPLRDAFAVLFFVSVGMLFDPTFVVREPLLVAAVVALVVLRKWVVSSAIVLALGYPVRTALIVGAGLAQIGEFSFILAGLGMSLGVLPAQGQSLILAGALISIALNPLVFAASEPALRWIRSRSALARKLDRSDDPLAELPMSTDTRFLKNQVVIVGYGRVGSAIGAALKERGIPFVVAEENREIVERLRDDGQAAVLGNAVEPETLVQAHIADARMLVVATPQTLEVRQMVETARTLNPNVQVVVRSHNEEEAALLEREQAGKVFVGEQELARAMTQHVLANVSAEATTP